MSELLICDENGNQLELPEDWTNLDSPTQDALLAWYNVRENHLQVSDLQRLADLFNAGQFEYGVCSECGEEYRTGTPDDWDDFQGVDELEHVGKVCAECYQKAADVIEISGVGWIGS